MVIELLHNIFKHDFKERSYTTAHYELVKSLKNANSENPIIQSHILFEKQIFEKYFTPSEQYKVAKAMSIDRCREIFKKAYTDCRVNLLTVGNITVDKCKDLTELFFSHLNITKHSEILLDDNMNRIRKLTEKIIRTPNPDETNSVGSVIYDFDRFRKDYTEHWKSQILFYRIYSTLVSNKFFYELRTKRQMGYIVKVKILLFDVNCHTNVFLEFIVQSPKYSVKDILKEINGFIENENKYILEKMSLKEYEEARNAEKTKLKQKFNNLSDLGSYFMSSIIDESFEFKYKDKSIKLCSNNKRYLSRKPYIKW
jgi:secreted Zn-dependent insulinase-like peptidase